MKKYNIIAPVLHAGVILASGEIELNIEDAERLIGLKAIENMEQPIETNISEMSLDELREYAKSKEIDLGKATKKEDILAIILEKAAAV
ncbi:hypothetical protein, partial [Paenibacillus sp. IHBB 10380]|uniref:hypothetical protein n=1 Tax=Paenibacillus sp. IHBB 10380 TaxID=1566358 RepID=UPI0005CF9541